MDVDPQDVLADMVDWLKGPSYLPGIFPEYDRANMDECDRPWHCLEVSRVLIVSFFLHM
jgi:hypothetical protein